MLTGALPPTAMVGTNALPMYQSPQPAAVAKKADRDGGAASAAGVAYRRLHLQKITGRIACMIECGSGERRRIYGEGWRGEINFGAVGCGKVIEAHGDARRDVDAEWHVHQTTLASQIGVDGALSDRR